MNSANHTLRIPKPDIFSFAECLHFLDRGYDDCLYTIGDNHVIKALRMEGNPFLLKISDESETLIIELFPAGCKAVSRPILKRAENYVARWFDLERDLHPFYRLLNRHNQLSFMPAQYYGLRIVGIPDLFEALCWCVIGQQINLTFAHRLKRRLVETYGTSISYNSRRHYLFPDPGVLANVTVDELREMQFSRRKAEYIIGIARDISTGTLSRSALENLSETTKMLNELKKIRGVGEWTANYVLMKSFQQLNCITFGDTGLQSSVSTMLELDRKPDRNEIETFFKPFSGWESYLNIYLWRTLS